MRSLFPYKEKPSLYDIDFEKLYNKGFRAAIIDIDNTIVPHGAGADKRAIEFFKRLAAIGIKTCLVSNNKEKRVSSFASEVKSPYIAKAGKPGATGYKNAMKIMGSGIEDTVFIGDQIFTDIWGANRLGIRTYLVRPVNPKEEIQIVLKRYLEAIVLYFYRRRMKKRRL